MRQRNMQHINFCSHQPASVGLLHSAAMKFSLITTIVLLALAQGMTFTSTSSSTNKSASVLFIIAVKNAWLLTYFLSFLTYRKLCTRCCRSSKARSVLWGNEDQVDSGFERDDPQPGPGKTDSVSSETGTPPSPHIWSVSSWHHT